jgi:phosphoenolpyruvate carboxylase
MDLSALIHQLGELLGDVIRQQETQLLFETEERIRSLGKERRAGDATAGPRLAEEVARLSPDDARVVAAAFTLYFDLVNLAEEARRANALRERERERYPQPASESVAEAVALLKERGLAPEQMADLLRGLRIELVLTAHPTEAKRRTILSKVERIARTLRTVNLGNPLPRERAALLDALRAEITALWLTDRARTSRPTVADEVKTGLYFVETIFWEALPRIYDELEVALAEHYPGLAAPPRWLTLASWIGGDRDGNPNVTAEVTAETLRLHRGLAVEKHQANLRDLARRLSFSARRLPPSPELQHWLDERRPFPPHAAFLERRYTTEPYRLVASLLAADLENESQDDVKTRLLAPPGAGLSNTPSSERIKSENLTTPLALVAESATRAFGPSDLLHTLQRQFEIFGLHAARLDLREDSSRLASALGEILRALKLDLAFEEGDDDSRTAVLTRLLSQPAPALAERPGITAETAETWRLFQLIARAQQVYGPDPSAPLRASSSAPLRASSSTSLRASLLGPFIISMTRGPADVLTVLLLALWAGCAANLQIVPLFETLDDLDAAPQILARLFSLGVYRAHLAGFGDEQMVMIGYSDSNKDGGYVSANWALYQAQENIARTCRDHNIKLTLFHGRGGTVARGGGPANRAIAAQPPGTINGRFRLTEQGEIIASRYADPDIAHRHLEQIVSAVLLASAPESEEYGSLGVREKGSVWTARNSAEGSTPKLPRPHAPIPLHWREAMSTMSAAARAEYRNLVYETPGFMDYWRAATPIDEISRLHLGSRPAARRSGGLQVLNIRAIPWVFSWMQSRFNLPGWYGLGTALISNLQSPISKTSPRDMYDGWPFFNALIKNAEMSLVKADLGIAALYSELAPDRALAGRILARIRDEYERTREAVLAITGQSELMESETVIQRSVNRRNPYVDPLNYIQVEMLRRLRALPDPESLEAESLREVIVFTINGIAAGLKNTG